MLGLKVPCIRPILVHQMHTFLINNNTEVMNESKNKTAAATKTTKGRKGK